MCEEGRKRAEEMTDEELLEQSATVEGEGWRVFHHPLFVEIRRRGLRGPGDWIIAGFAKRGFPRRHLSASASPVEVVE